ncbi:MAG: UvrD-helicase domain-containing protein [candidate division SR1 bacterium]|nr:UvrD-helicase domain-containing protein [candidate division SR1 bacterium]
MLHPLITEPSNLDIFTETQHKIIENLNDRQREAVLSTTGSNLIIAGAGSGKTAVLTRRVAYLISQGITPGQILCLTFTNKAAAEMNKRVRSLLDSVQINLPYIAPWQQDYLQNPLLCTFHSLGVRILREFGDKIDLKKEFSILDSDDQKKIVRQILKELNISEKNLQPSLAIYFISQCKQASLVSSESNKISKDFLPIFHQIYAKYESQLKKSQIVDFDDLILLPYIILSQNQDIRQILYDRWHHLMVDEFQDTNPAQFELIRLLMPLEGLRLEKEKSLFVVGDDAQSIYGFRGSKIEIILNFQDEYPGTKEVVLNQNYRSVQPILDLAEKVIAHNPNQKKKDLFTNNREVVDVHYYVARNDRDEAEFILRKLQELYINEQKADIKKVKSSSELIFEADENSYITKDYTKSKDFVKKKDPISSMFDIYLESDDNFGISRTGLYDPYSWQVPEIKWKEIKKLDEVVILYRTHSQSRSIEEVLLKHNVPYKLVSGTRFLDRKEIKDIIAMLKFLANGSDRVSMGRFLPLIMDGVGPKTLGKMIAYLDDFDYPLAPKYAQMLMDLIEKMQRCWTTNSTLIELTKELLTITGYMKYLKSEYPVKDEFEARVENIGEIYSLMFPFDEDKEMPLTEKLNQFLAAVMLMSSLEMDEADDVPKISLMSLHQSKGLEYETVFLVGVEDGLLPHQNSFFEVGGMEEEVRLAYVGVTRAKKHLYLTSAESRIQFGQIKANPISRIFRPFLDVQVKRTR